MRAPFRRNRSEPRPGVDPIELEELLPASVRQPEANRFKALGMTASIAEDGEDNSADADLDFLQSLANSIEQGSDAPELPTHFVSKPQLGGPVIREPQSRQQTEQPEREQKALSLFRDTKLDRDERVRPNITVPDVEMSDLMEDLATLRSALLQRKAA